MRSYSRIKNILLFPLRKLREKKLHFDGYHIYYQNRESLQQTLEEIFTEQPYQFTTDKKQPFIIDAGSNIGIATIFFKKHYPNAKLVCFEPDPQAFKLLKKNIKRNHFNDVELVNAALSNRTGEVNFYGQIYTKEADSRGNSLVKTWGLQRQKNDTIKVNAVKLSSYISQEIDFLKMDIEGAELQVLEELEKSDKLKYIKTISLEVHVAQDTHIVNNTYFISSLLTRNNFSLQVNEKKLEGILPEPTHEWAKRMQPRLFIINAKRL